MTAKRGSARHAVRLSCPPDDVWAAARRPPTDPGVVSGHRVEHGRGRPTGRHHRLRHPHARAAAHRRPRAAALQYRITAPDVHGAPRHHRRARPRRRHLPGRLLAPTPILPRWPWSSAVRPVPGSGPVALGCRRPGQPARDRHLPRSKGSPLMGRKILLVTTDQQRYDTLGCNGGTLGRTPVVDGLAAAGVRFERAHPQSVVCMPSRSTILTGQYPTTHGVWMNGVPLPSTPPRWRRAPPGRLPHRPDRARPTSSRSSTRSCASPRTPWPRRAPNLPAGSTGASSTSSWPPTGPSGRSTTRDG